MKTNLPKRARPSWLWGIVVAGLLGGHAAQAAIIGGTASADVLVQELIDGAPASVTSDQNEADLLSGPLPVSSAGKLTSTDLEGVLVSQGRGVAQLSDPTRLDQANPEEFRLEAACYSNADNVSYVVNTGATQRRDVVFTTTGNPLADVEIDFNTDGTQEIESRVFLSGAVLVWSTGAAESLAGLQGEIQFTVTSDDTAPLFTTSLSITADDTGGVAFETTGPLTVTALSLDDLAATGLLDSGTLEALAAIEQDGVLQVLAIEAQVHTYTYQVAADTEFTLAADMRLNLRAPPGGVGIAATLGGPFETLAAFVKDGLPGVAGESLARSINTRAGLDATGSDAPVGSANDSPPAPASPGLRACGAFGFESMLLLLIPFSLPLCLRRR